LPTAIQKGKKLKKVDPLEIKDYSNGATISDSSHLFGMAAMLANSPVFQNVRKANDVDNDGW
jgi:hypothetical protein